MEDQAISSLDKTWRISEEFSDFYPIKTIRRIDKRGLASAVVEGIKETNNDIIVVMDGDLQHSPGRIPNLIKWIKKGKELVICSRFVEGGDPGDFGFLRRLISFGATFIAKTIFRETRSIKDIQSGFFAFKKEGINLEELKPKGYKILIEILVHSDFHSFKEIGYKFRNREYGDSKLGFKEIFNYIHHILSLSYRSGELKRFIKFGFVGTVGS
ncbi:hypothetical protein C9439_03875 [archaeon SCG-AAA382B04]|nr:hypothetical protein C9439_03875 [archaeon SCG-AAA382B04]